MTDAPSQSHPWGDFYYLLGCADSASKAADDFDLHSEIPESKAEFERLCAERAEACIKLIRFCAEHHEALIAAFESEGKQE